MATQLIMTVGTNALPVWVAWYHLRKKLEGDVSVRFVHTDQTKSETERLKEKIEVDCPSTKFLTPIPIKPGEPHAVRSAIKDNIINDLPADRAHLHVHYTGGTKAMGVETVSIIEKEVASKENVTLNASYLDPRGDHGPKIVSRTQLRVQDTRKSVKTDLNGIANLNGIEFKNPPSKPNATEIERGIQYLDNNWPPPPTFRTHSESLGAVLEYGAFAAFKQALKTRKGKTQGYWDIFQGSEGKRISRRDERVTPQSFELDVVAVLGYQVVVVSCTTDDARNIIKLKAMEAIIRAKQLGGEEAHAIMLCRANHTNCSEIQAGLEDEMGSDAPHLRIWGETKRGKLPNLNSLTYRFGIYLNDLKW